MRLERREKALENRNGHRRRRQPASPSIIKRLLSHEHDAKACFMPLTCLRWMARTFAASGLMTGYGRAGRRCLRPLVIRCGSIDARQRGVPTRRPIRTDPMRRCMTMARSRAEPRVFAPTGCPICLEGSKNSAPASHAARRSATTLPPRFDSAACQGPQQRQRRRAPMLEGMDRHRDAAQSRRP
jgi:hypothetical protein